MLVSCQDGNAFLSHNPITNLSKELFKHLANLSSLDLEEVEIDNINEGIFSNMKNLDFIYFKRYYYCTFAPHIPKCAPKSDGLSTFEDLLGRPILRTVLWFVAITTLFGNGYVLWGRLTTRDDNKSLSWIVRNLAVSDLLMGIYLSMIGIKDQQFRGNYHQVSHEWMESWYCCFAGALAMVSSEVSVFILIFMSFERFLIIAVPFSGRKTLNPQSAGRCVSVIWTIGLALAICPIILWRSSTKFYGANGMCFPLHLDDPYFAGWQFSAFVFLLLNFSGIIIVAALYSGMFISIWRTRHAASLSSGDFEFAVRFFFIVLTNSACWLPIVVLKILALYRIYISSDAYAWVAVFVVPVNSAFNPLLYTLTTTKYREMLSSVFVRNKSKTIHSKSSLETSWSLSSNPRKRSGERQSSSFDGQSVTKTGKSSRTTSLDEPERCCSNSTDRKFQPKIAWSENSEAKIFAISDSNNVSIPLSHIHCDAQEGAFIHEYEL